MGERDWKVWFYSGMVFYRYYGDRLTAAEYFARAARVDSPHSGKLARLAAAFYQEAGRTGEALGLLRFMLETTEDPRIRGVIEEKILELLR
jgi:hypothetical protein